MEPRETLGSFMGVLWEQRKRRMKPSSSAGFGSAPDGTTHAHGHTWVPQGC